MNIYKFAVKVNIPASQAQYFWIIVILIIFNVKPKTIVL